MLTKKENQDMRERLNKASRKKIGNIEYVSAKAVELLLQYYTADNAIMILPLPPMNLAKVN